MTDEIFIGPDGGQLKSLGNGRYGGFLIVYSDENSPDLHGDFFTRSTELFVESGATLPILYDHGFDDAVQRQKIGKGTITQKDEGLWLEFQLEKRAKYITAIEKLCASGKCGLSSGAAGHLVSKHPTKSGARWIAEWGLAEASVTTEPAEPRTSVMPLKTYLETRPASPILDIAAPSYSLAARLTQYIDDLVDDGKTRDEIVKSLAREALMDTADVEQILSGAVQRPTNATLKAFGRTLALPFKLLKGLVDRTAPTSIKDLFTEELAGRTPGTWEYESAYRCVIKKIAEAARSARAVGAKYDSTTQIKEATASYVDALEPAVLAQVQKYVESEDMMDEEFYLRSLTQLTKEDFELFSKGITFDEHLRLVATAEEDLIARFIANADKPRGRSTKAGRELSDKNRQRLVKLMQSHKENADAVQAQLRELLDSTQPMATDEQKRIAQANHLRVKHLARVQPGA